MLYLKGVWSVKWSHHPADVTEWIPIHFIQFTHAGSLKGLQHRGVKLVQTPPQRYSSCVLTFCTTTGSLLYYFSQLKTEKRFLVSLMLCVYLRWEVKGIICWVVTWRAAVLANRMPLYCLVAYVDSKKYDLERHLISPNGIMKQKSLLYSDWVRLFPSKSWRNQFLF